MHITFFRPGLKLILVEVKSCWQACFLKHLPCKQASFKIFDHEIFTNFYSYQSNFPLKYPNGKEVLPTNSSFSTDNPVNSLSAKKLLSSCSNNCLLKINEISVCYFSVYNNLINLKSILFKIHVRMVSKDKKK